jgi:hypothetical protein
MTRAREITDLKGRQPRPGGGSLPDVRQSGLAERISRWLSAFRDQAEANKVTVRGPFDGSSDENPRGSDLFEEDPRFGNICRVIRGKKSGIRQ